MFSSGNKKDAPMAIYGETSRTLKDAQDLGERTLFAMDQQLEQLASTREKAQEVSGFTKATHREIAGMGRRRAIKRCVLWLIILVQFAVIGGMFYRLGTNGFRFLDQEPESGGGEDGGLDREPDAADDHFP